MSREQAHRLECLQRRFDRVKGRSRISSGLHHMRTSLTQLVKNTLSLNKAAELDHMHTVFLFISVPSRQSVEEYKKIEEDVHRTISSINGRFSTATHQPIVYIHRGISIDELAALYARADCCLVTPLADGMNLVAKEFIAAKDRRVDNVVPGSIVLSELTGAAHELFDALVVNPHDEDAVADAIHVGLELTRGDYLSEEQRWEVTERMRHEVLKNDATAWARSMLLKMQAVSSRIPPRQRTSVPKLPDNIAALFSAKVSGNKAVIIHCEGALPSDSAVSGAELQVAAELLLTELAAREDLRVFLISGGGKEVLESRFGGVKELTLIAENGFFVRRPGQSWELFNPFISIDWMDKVKHVMDLSTCCTPGSFVQTKAASVVWNYSACDEEYSQFKAKELIHQLSLSVANLPCQVCQGDKIVEVTSPQVRPGLVVRKHILAAESFVEVVCIGDDPVAETIFSDAPESTYTVRIGRDETFARYCLPDRACVHRFLGLLAEQHGLMLPDTFRSFDNARSPCGTEDALDCLPEEET